MRTLLKQSKWVLYSLMLLSMLFVASCVNRNANKKEVKETIQKTVPVSDSATKAVAPDTTKLDTTMIKK